MLGIIAFATAQPIDNFQKANLALNEEKDVDFIYLDIAKTYDKADHNVLLRKNFNFGIGGS